MVNPRTQFLKVASAFVLAGIVLLLPAAVAQADYLFTEGGSIYRGRIVRSEEGKVTIWFVDGGNATFNEDDIVAVEPEMEFAARILAGNRALNAGEVDQALRHFLIAEIEDNHNRLTLLGLSRAYMRANDLEKARARARTGVFLHGSDPDLHLQYGEVLSLLGEFRDAEKEFDAAIANDPNNPLIRTLATAAHGRNRKRENDPNFAGRQPDIPFDPSLGDNADTAELCDAMLAWAREVDVNAFPTGKLSAVADTEGNRALADGNIEVYRLYVETVLFEPVVEHNLWTALDRRDREITLLGWYYQIVQRYPNALIEVVVLSKVGQNYDTVATSRWNESRDRVDIDLNP